MSHRTGLKSYMLSGSVSLLRRCLLPILVITILFIILIVKPHTDVARAVFTMIIKPKSHRIADETISDLPQLPVVPLCPIEVVNPVGPIVVNKTPLAWPSIIVKYNNVSLSPAADGDEAHPLDNTSGLPNSLPSSNSSWYKFMGVWSPVNCTPSQTLAIIIPYRNREMHLRVFVNHMHNFLRHQRLAFTIIVVEQLGNSTFNRGALMNIGFRESTRIAPFTCFIFHDVDLLPENDLCPYRCGDQPVHLPVALDTFKYKLLYKDLFGGAVALYRQQFITVNGFSNAFFGWGGEDDDLSQRIRLKRYEIFRNPAEKCHFTMISHKRDTFNKENPNRFNLLKTVPARMRNDGFNEIDYKLVLAEPRHNGLIYWLSIELDEKSLSDKFGSNTKHGQSSSDIHRHPIRKKLPGVRSATRP